MTSQRSPGKGRLSDGIYFRTHLEVTKIGPRRIEEADRGELNGGINTHKLEATKACHQGSSALTFEH